MSTAFSPQVGNRDSLPSTKTAGKVYWCADDGTMWLDYVNGSGVLTRKQIGAAIEGTSVTLTVSGWNTSTLTQSVTVSGIVADESAQMINWMPSTSSLSVAQEAGVVCTAQSANTLTFSCSTVPTAAITVYITFQDVIFN